MYGSLTSNLYADEVYGCLIGGGNRIETHFNMRNALLIFDMTKSYFKEVVLDLLACRILTQVFIILNDHNFCKMRDHIKNTGSKVFRMISCTLS